MNRYLWLMVSAAGLVVASAALGAPPENADPALAPWFRSLAQPGTGISCCSIADCRPVDTRITSGGYEIYVKDQWLTVPPEKVLQGKQNPTGKPVACVLNGQVLCFVPGTMV
ncbi:MAG: hypothetical protein JO128_18795 [Alphaproteobacteria bacterium]|nr:hypothetical protein [Alphaproteobacteria bacterium]